MHSSSQGKNSLRSSLLLMICFVLLLGFSSRSEAKSAGLVAIEVYPSSHGQSYQQVQGFTLNGKLEVYQCGGAAQLDKSAYHKLEKLILAVGMSLERNADGTLTLSRPETDPVCIIPANLKYEGSATYSPGQITDKTTVDGRIVGSSDPADTQIISIKPGIKILFVTGPDTELAEYVRAQRANDVSDWQIYLSKYPAALHAADAKKSLAAIYLQMLNSALKDYTSSASGNDPNYGKLKEAFELAVKSRLLLPDDNEAKANEQKILDVIRNIAGQAVSKLNDYKQALAQGTAGYANLVNAESLATEGSLLNPSMPEVTNSLSQTKQARTVLENTLRDCEAKIAVRKTDEAASAIVPLRSFAGEYKRVDNDIKQIVSLYIAQSENMGASSDWHSAVENLEKANNLAPSQELASRLKSAQEQMISADNKVAAAAAIQKSTDLEAQNDILEAYEILDDLPRGQRELVSERLDGLKDRYVDAAQTAAKELQKAHEPINGLADEQGIEKAYGYLQRCYDITAQPTFQDRMAFLGDDLSVYYLQQGKKYTEKPDGSGVNVGWQYLMEALPYKSQQHLSDINDVKSNATQAHFIKSHLSVTVDFRDQTPRREAVDFARQMIDAIATGLEQMGQNVLVYRAQDTTKVPTNFRLIGDVVRNDMDKTLGEVAIQSKFRADVLKVPNPDWVKLNGELSNANNELKSAQSLLQGVASRGKKNEIKDANGAIQIDEKKVEEIQTKLDATPREVSQDDLRNYTYTKVTHKLTPDVELQFRILDSTGVEVVSRVSVEKQTLKQYDELQNVKPDDTLGVHMQNVIPNDNDFLETEEREARDELINKASEKIKQLPAVVFGDANRKADEGDVDGAGELYILYLYSTPPGRTAERLKAQNYLLNHFNFKMPASSTANQ
jgi:hypothetical protein